MSTLRWILFLVTLAIGIGLGLYYGWVVSPVQYVDTSPSTMRIDYRADYVLMIAEVFHSDHNIEAAAHRMASLGSKPPVEIAGQALSFAQQNGYSSADVALIQDLVLSLQVWQPGGGVPPAVATPATTPGNKPVPTASIDVTPTDGGAP